MPTSRPFTGRCSHRVSGGVLHNVYALRALTGVLVQRCLGCGANGCAFRAEDSMVLKVSAHEGEAPIAEILKGHGRVWPFLPVFYGAWITPGDIVGERLEVGITLREDLIDFKPFHRDTFVSEATTFLNSARHADSTSEIKRLRKELDPVLEDMPTFDAKALKMLADFAVWSSNYGLGFDLEEFTEELAIQNLGWSLDDDAVVIRDLGNFYPERGALASVRRATLQRVREQNDDTR